MKWHAIISPHISSRNKLFIENTFLNAATKLIGIAINLLLIPILLHVLHEEKFGIYQTILSIIAWGALINFGLGNGLRNVISTLVAERKENDIGKIIGTTLKISFRIILIVGIPLISLVSFFLDPSLLFKGTTVSAFEIKVSLIVFLGFFLFNLLLGISNSIAYGYQKSYLPGVALLAYQILCLISILLLKSLININLISISFIFGITQSIVYLLLFFVEIKYLKVSIVLKEKADVKNIFSLSRKFFIIQLISIVYLSIDNILISYKLGANQTTEYSVMSKVFFSLINLYSISLIQLWSSTTEAFINKDFKWIKKILKILVILAIIVFLGSLLISFFSAHIMRIWLGSNSLSFSVTSFYLFSIYTFIHCLNSIYLNVQNGVGNLTPQIISIILAIFILVGGFYFLDIRNYNEIILLKIAGTALALAINSVHVKTLLK